MRLAHLLRAAMTTRPFERDALQVAPDIVRIVEDEVAERGPAAASLVGRAQRQIGEASRTAEASGIEPAAGR